MFQRSLHKLKLILRCWLSPLFSVIWLGNSNATDDFTFSIWKLFLNLPIHPNLPNTSQSSFLFPLDVIPEFKIVVSTANIAAVVATNRKIHVQIGDNIGPSTRLINYVLKVLLLQVLMKTKLIHVCQSYCWSHRRPWSLFPRFGIEASLRTVWNCTASSDRILCFSTSLHLTEWLGGHYVVFTSSPVLLMKTTSILSLSSHCERLGISDI